MRPCEEEGIRRDNRVMRWWLSYPRPQCPFCAHPKMVLSDKQRARQARNDPDHGPLVTLRCPSAECGRRATFTATAPARHIDRRRLVKLRPDGINRDEVQCRRCG